MDQEIDIAELQQISNKIFDHILHVLQIRSVSLTKDMYWTISPDQKYNIDSSPVSFGVGQLYDDLEFLRKILTDEDQACPAMMMHLAPIFYYLSTQVSWYTQRGKMRGSAE